MPDKDELKKAYARFGAKLKTSEDESKRESTEIIQEGVSRLEDKEIPFLPADLAQRMLSTKIMHDMPETLVPMSYFEKPRFRGKKDFYQRLAADILLFGLSYQRSYGTPPSESEFPELFLKNRSWWKTTNEEIQDSLKILVTNKIVNIKDSYIEFEPIEASREITRVLTWIGSNKLEKVSIDLLCDSLEIDPVQSRRVMEQLVREGIAKKDDDDYWIPSFF